MSRSACAVVPSANRAVTPSSVGVAATSRLPYSIGTPRRTASSRNPPYSAARVMVWVLVPSGSGAPKPNSAMGFFPPMPIDIFVVANPLSRTTVCRSSTPSAAMPLTASVRNAPTPSAPRSYAS